MTLWIARDKNWEYLTLFTDFPYAQNGVWRVPGHDNMVSLNPDTFPEVTFENSPQLVELKLINENGTLVSEK